MKSRRLALGTALVLAVLASSQPASAGWTEPQDGPHSGFVVSADFEGFMLAAGVGLEVAQAAL